MLTVPISFRIFNDHNSGIMFFFNCHYQTLTFLLNGMEVSKNVHV